METCFYCGADILESRFNYKEGFGEIVYSCGHKISVTFTEENICQDRQEDSED